MFAHLMGVYWILSNRESGKGRVEFSSLKNSKVTSLCEVSNDFCLKAKNKYAEGTGPLIRQSRFLSPLSSVSALDSQNWPKGRERAADDGMRQIEDKAYVRELISVGYTRIFKISLAVDGKDIEAMISQ